MANVKTAISIREPLFKEVDDLARQMHISRSQLFVRAVEEFLQHYRNQQLLEKINSAYSDGLDYVEQDLQSKMKPRHRKMVEGQW